MYQEFQQGNLAAAKRIQFELLDLVNAMLCGTNFPEGFRAGMSLRGFNLGKSRQPLSPREQSDLEEIRSKLARILAGLLPG
jgi:dihydrodipicolinate synthase/N-acetylneuraminate lyase